MLLSIGDQVKPGSYRLHSVFKRVVNFERRGRLVSVVDQSVGPGPLNIVLSEFRRLSFARGGVSAKRRWMKPRKSAALFRGAATIHEAAALVVNAHTVTLASGRYQFRARQRYCSAFKLRALNLRQFESNLVVLKEVIKRGAPGKSLAFLLKQERRRHLHSAFECAYTSQIERGVHDVFHGQLLQGIRRLKGCGIGLTPGGDDFIAGVLVGLNVLQQLHGEDYRPTLNAIFRAAEGRNIFSNTFLALAHRGLAFGRLKDLLVALTSGSPGCVRESARSLFGMGETSGADLATGLCMTLGAGPIGATAKARCR